LKSEKSRKDKTKDEKQSEPFNDNSNNNSNNNAETPEKQVPKKERPKHGGGGRKGFPNNIPRQTIRVDLPDEEKSCPRCGDE
jgi:hypothetical protein